MPSENANEQSQITISKKFLIVLLLAIFLAFIGGVFLMYIVGGIPYQNDSVPEFDVEVSSDKQSAEAVIFPERPTFTRGELLTRGAELMVELGVEKGLHDAGTENLYMSTLVGDHSHMYVPYKENGLSMLVPYSLDWGAPYYRLLPYEKPSDSVLVFGGLNPCPSGCSGSGAIHNNTVRFLPPGLIEELTNDFLKENEYNNGYCNTVQINKEVSGIQCYPNAAYSEAPLFIEGSKHIYEFNTYSGCSFDDYCSVMFESLRVE